MTYSALISLAIFAGIAITLWKVCDICQRQDQLVFLINDLCESLEAIQGHSKETEKNTIKAFNDICNSLNAFFTTSGNFMNHSMFALQNIAVCMLPIVDDIKEQALEDENYERAQECVKIINNLKQIVELKYHG